VLVSVHQLGVVDVAAALMAAPKQIAGARCASCGLWLSAARRWLVQLAASRTSRQGRTEREGPALGNIQGTLRVLLPACLGCIAGGRVYMCGAAVRRRDGVRARAAAPHSRPTALVKRLSTIGRGLAETLRHIETGRQARSSGRAGSGLSAQSGLGTWGPLPSLPWLCPACPACSRLYSL
jgi:hypothetical protein